MTIDIIVPLYNAEDYILDLDKSIKKQRNVEIKNIHYILTESKDNTERILNKHEIPYQKIKREEFSHSLTREKVAMESDADILVFITQDIEIQSELWLYYLTKGIKEGLYEAAFSRQIANHNNLEKYTREKNYPKNDRIVSKEDIPRLGLNTFFFSDASSAIKTSVFQSLEGYDGKKLPISEDMYIAYKIIMDGMKIGYVADSEVYHSHNFTLKELYNRYKLTGQFFKENSYLDKYGTNKAGGGLAFYVLKRALAEKNYKVILRFPFDMAARFIGMKVGKKYGKKEK